MVFRASRSFPLLIALAVTCGCNPQSSYNESSDPAKDAAAIGADKAPQRSAAAAKKIKKPPGPVPRGAKNLQPLD
jgi:hypothetical protein